MRTRSRAQVAATKAAGRRTPKRLPAGQHVVRLPRIADPRTEAYDVRAYYALRPELYYSDVAKAPITFKATPAPPFSANRAADERIRELEDEILARRAKR